MASIDVDFDVHRELTARRTSEAISYNDVLRDLLGLPPKHWEPEKTASRPTSQGWKARGGTFAEGTEIRLTHKGEVRQGRVEKGAFLMQGKVFDSVEDLAEEITHGNRHDWIFWSQRKPGESSWTDLKAFRAEDPE
jgi:hypothetical protein